MKLLDSVQVGDKFENSLRSVITVVAVSEGNVCCNIGNLSRLYLFSRDGKSYISNMLPIVKRHIPSEKWFPELPPAALLSGIWLSCDKDNNWYTYRTKPVKLNGAFTLPDYTKISGIKMPKLSGDEWEKSLILIEKLATWQG